MSAIATQSSADTGECSAWGDLAARQKHYARLVGNSEPDPIEVVDERRLKSGLRPRHLVMMSLGSAIGAGLFVGSGQESPSRDPQLWSPTQ